MARAVISTIAEDRPGLVSELSEIIHDLGLNIEDSRMTVLGGEFAVLMSITGDEAPLGELDARLQAQAANGGFAYLFRLTSEQVRSDQQIFTASIEAMDHPGIVSGITRFFSERGVNIRELTTETTRAAHTGAPVFNLTMEVEAAADNSIGDLRDAFVAFCAAESLDGELIAL